MRPGAQLAVAGADPASMVPPRSSNASSAGLTVIVTLGLAAAGANPLAVIVKVAGPTTLGVPASSPLVALRRNPGGKVPDATAKTGGGFPEAAKVYDHGVPTVAATGGTSAV